MQRIPRTGYLACCGILGAIACGFVTLSLMPDQSEAQAPRTDRRVLFSFEEPAELARLARKLDQAELIAVQDNGVTDGKQCARLTVRKGSEYGGLELDAAAIKNWSGYDYFAIDVYMEDATEQRVVVELWDGQTRNYATRCTWEDVTTHAGRQTLLFPIKRSRRNGKEGREWDELEPQDKINLNGLTRVKIFTTPKADHDAVFWIDHLRLLQEDAAKPKLTLPVPEGALAFNFGSAGSAAPGFQLVTPETKLTASVKHGFRGTNERTQGGEGWPDLIGGTFISASEGQELDFQAQVPNGNYFYWLISGPIYRAQPENFHFQLRLNGHSLTDATPTPNEYFSEKHLYRFLRTQYSEKPDALWTNYLNRMYPVLTGSTRVTDGTVRVQAINHFVSALVLIPASAKPKFDEFVAVSDRLRRAAFAQTLPPASKSTDKLANQQSYTLFAPARSRVIRPSTQPTPQESATKSLTAAGARGETVVLRLAVAPTVDLGQCTVTISDLKLVSDSTKSIRASGSRVYFQNYRFDGRSLDEMVLAPQSTWNMESGVTQCCWIRLLLSTDYTPGIYRGQIAFQSHNKTAKTLPVEIEVYPFKLETDLPVSYGLYYAPRTVAGIGANRQRQVRLDQLKFMREIGLTSVSVGGPGVQGLGANNSVKLKFDTELFELAKEAGLGRLPGQHLMATALGMGRAIGRRLPGSEGALVDRNPGIELKQPEFAGYFLNGAKQYRDFLKQQGLPVAVEIVDEPRETPNPWNRNLADTLTYAKLLHQAGLTTFVTPMSDKNDGKDYTVLADHADIISVHAWPASAGLIRNTQRKSKTLWLYNTGMDRFSWGFYPWSKGATGRWEWHFCWNEDRGQGGYPGRDGFNPFTGSHGFVPEGPIDQPIVFQSKLLDVAEGIRDYTYLYTLESRLAAAKDKSSTAVAAGKRLLAQIRAAIPEFPEVKGLADASAGALVGEGAQEPFQAQAAAWRREIAEVLKQLK